MGKERTTELGAVLEMKSSSPKEERVAAETMKTPSAPPDRHVSPGRGSCAQVRGRVSESGRHNERTDIGCGLQRKTKSWEKTQAFCSEPERKGCRRRTDVSATGSCWWAGRADRAGEAALFSVPSKSSPATTL